MSLRTIRTLADPMLGSPALPVTVFDATTAALVTDLIDTLYLDGWNGLSAPQIGIPLAVFAFDIGGQIGYVINPVITAQSGKCSAVEACGSTPGVRLSVVRPDRITILGQDLDGNPKLIGGPGEIAQSLHHQMDHLLAISPLTRIPRHRRGAARRSLRDAQCEL